MTLSSNPAARLAIFTICSNNYLPMARAFFASARQQHPEAALFLCLADRLAQPVSRYGDLAEVVTFDRLAIANLVEFTFRYDVMELNTAAKPFMFNYLFEIRQFEQVVYFDPDIILYAPIASVLSALNRGAAMVLTPHVCRPAESAGNPRDHVFMLAGVFNLGFMAAARCDEASDLLHWWARRLRYDCVNEQEVGLFVDQKFIDLAPSFVPSLHISQDTALNVAYWNISQRELFQTPACWTVDGHPLVFFHFSGLDPDRPERLSRHAPPGGPTPDGALAALIADYVGRLRAAGLGKETVPAYAFGHFASGVPIPALVRRMFRMNHPAYFDDPFSTYEATLHLPAPDATRKAAPFLVTTLIHFIHSQSAWLSATYDLADPDGVRGLVTWFIRHAAQHFGLDLRLITPVSARIANPRAQLALAAPRDSGADVTLIGYLRATSGVGQAARMTLAGLAACPDLRCDGVDIDLNVVSSRDEHAALPLLTERGTGRIQIFHINADQLPSVIHATHDRLRPGYRIAIPYWELAALPDAWHRAFDGMDEIWAPSRFIQTALLRSIDKPVIHMPPALSPLMQLPGGRQSFGLPRRSFLFFFAFDALSYPTRKNPLGAVAAFTRAFPRDGAEPVGLVIKSMNAQLAPDAFAALQDAVADDPRIVLLDRVLARDDLTRLVSACDCVLSLHRSEGFGLLIAEAMLLGKPVIATDYGATTELVTPQTGFAVQYRLVAVKEGEYPFACGNVWADPDIAHAAWLMQQIQERPDFYASQVATARAHVSRTHGPGANSARLQARLRAIDGIAA